MAIFTLTYTKKNSLLKSVRMPELKRENGEIKDSRVYKGDAIPGTVQGRCIKFDTEKNRFPITIEDDKLQDIVKEAALFDSDGNQILECNVRNRRDKFLTHPEMKVYFESGTASLEDETPKGKIWDNYTNNQSDFRGKKKPNERLGAKDVSAQVTKVNNVDYETAVEQDNLDVYTKASKLRAACDYDKSVKILKGMGVNFRGNNPSPESVEQTLTKKVFVEGEYKARGSNKRNIELFIELAETSDDELSIKGLIKDARTNRIIVKKSNNYLYGEVPLGSNLEEVEEYLSDPDHKDIWSEIYADLYVDEE